MADITRHGRRWRGPQRGAQRGSVNSARISWPRTLLAKHTQPLQREHLRFQPREARGGVLHCFLLDCSGSMLGGQRLARAKGALLQLIQRAYAQRAQVAIVSFAGKTANVWLAPTTARPLSSREVHAWLRPVSGGGDTPLQRGVFCADELLSAAARRSPAQQRWLWLLSDGRSEELPPPPSAADVITVVDCEQQRVRLGRCRVLAELWDADYIALDDLIV